MLWGNNNATDEEIYEALRKAEILPLIESYKDKLDHEVLIDGKNFSGGQKQRLTIARAFLKKAGILILDDSTSAVDKITEKNIQNAISTLSEHPITKIIISQRISSVKDCDNIIVLEDGKITAQGNHKDLISNSLLYQEIYNSNKNDEKVLKELNELLPEELNMSEKNKKLYKELLEKQSAKNPGKTFFRIISYIKYNIKSYIFGLILLIIASILEISQILVLKPIIDSFTTKDPTHFISSIIMFTILMLLSLIINYFGTLIIAKVAQNIVYKIRKELFSKMQKIGIDFFDKNPSGETISIFTNDVELLSTAIDQSLSKILISVISFILTFATLIYLNVLLALLSLVLISVYIVIMYIFAEKSTKHARLKQYRLAHLSRIC